MLNASYAWQVDVNKIHVHTIQKSLFYQQVVVPVVALELHINTEALN